MSLEQELIGAAMDGHLDVVKSLVEQGANLHAENEEALTSASANGHFDVVKYLVEHGADFHVNDEALGLAASYGRLDVVKYLIEQGADLHVLNENPLKWSSWHGHLEIVKYLVELGADLHVEGELALRGAAINGHLDVIKYLIEQGANPQIILDKPGNYKLEIINYIYYLTKVRPIIMKINDQIEYAPLGRFKSFLQGGVKYQENSYRLLWTRIGQEIGNAPPNHLKLLPNGSSGYQETKEWIEKEYPEKE